MNAPRTHPDRSGDLDERWYGWGSPVGLGIAVLCLALAIAAVLASLSLF